MNKIQRLRKNNEFQEVFQKGRSTANRQLVIYVLNKPGQEYSRMGLSVSKKMGNAVTRNRIRRYIKESIRLMEDKLEIGNDFIIISRKPTADMDFHQMEKSLYHVLKLAGMFKKKG